MTRSGIDKVKAYGDVDGAGVTPCSSFILNDGRWTLAAPEGWQFTPVYRCWKTTRKPAIYCHNLRSVAGHRGHGTSFHKLNGDRMIGSDLCFQCRLKNPVALIALKLPPRIVAVVHYPRLESLPRISLPVSCGRGSLTLAWTGLKVVGGARRIHAGIQCAPRGVER